MCYEDYLKRKETYKKEKLKQLKEFEKEYKKYKRLYDPLYQFSQYLKSRVKDVQERE